MEQLQRDRNYSNYLLRLVDVEARKNNSKDDLLKFINQLNSSINSDEVIKYVEDNHLKFDYRVYSDGIKKILEEFDRSHEAQINSSDYKQMQVDNTNYIVAKDGTVLEQNSTKNMGDLAQDFKNKQNEMFGAKTDDSLVNADQAFDVMKAEMEESNFMPLNKVDVNKIPQELIMKINFLIKNPGINYNDFQVDIKRGTFINTKNNELYDVRRDPQTNQFKLYKSQQAVYTQNENVVNNIDNSINNNGDNILDNQSNISQNNNKLGTDDLAMFSDEELRAMTMNKGVTDAKRNAIMAELNNRRMLENEKKNVNVKQEEKVKKKVLTKNSLMPNLNGYASTILITAISAISGILLATILLINR